MPSDRTTRSWLEIAFAILLLMPVAVLFFAAAESGMRGWMWFTLILLLCVWMLWIFARGPGARGRRDEGERERAEGPRMLHADEQPEMVREIMDVRVAMLDRGIRVLRGPLRVPSAAAYEALKRESPKDIVPLLQEDGELGAAVVLLPRPVEERGRERPSRPWVHWLLFFLAAVTTTAAGARYQGVDVFEEPGKLYVGLPYALGLLLILGVTSSATTSPRGGTA